MQTIKFFSIVASVCILFFSLPSQAKSVASDEYQAVIDTAYAYFNGAANGDQALLAKAFDMDFGHVKVVHIDEDTGKESIRSLTLKQFTKFFKQATQDTWQANILAVDIVDNNMAMVKLNFHTSNHHYIDYLVMYKRENNWKIINKTFVARKK